MILVHYFDSSGGGDMTQIMPSPEKAFNLVLVFYEVRPWMGSHGYDGRPGLQPLENVIFVCMYIFLGKVPIAFSSFSRVSVCSL